jgi:hypothetical protein
LIPSLAASGQVLVAGPQASGASDLYDQAANMWTVAASAVTPRQDTATAGLSDGRVVVVGGRSVADGQWLNSAETWDPSSAVVVPPPPSVTGIAPAGGGPTYGGTSVTITGHDLFPASSIRFGTADAVSITSNSDTSVVAVSPAHAAGTVDVTVATPGGPAGGGGTSPVTSASKWAYKVVSESPVVSDLSPRVGVGGTTVTLTGTALSLSSDQRVSPVGVRFGGVPALAATAVTPTSITVTAPPARTGSVVPITVVTPVGTSTVSKKAMFTYASGSWDQAAPTTDCAGSTAECIAHYDQTATLLDPPACHSAAPPKGYPCGKVLVTGGQHCLETPGVEGPACTPPRQSGAELYDPATGGWTRAGAFDCDGGGGSCVSRIAHTATLLNDGRVLVLGGADTVTGGTDVDGVALATAAIYDPLATSDPPSTSCGVGGIGCWTATKPLITPRFLATATLLDGPACRVSTPAAYCGKVLVAGGNYEDHPPPAFPEPRAEAELFNPTGNLWESAAPLNLPRYDHTATLLDGAACHGPMPPSYCGTVLVAGGLSLDGQNLLTQKSSELYDPAGITGVGAGVLPGSWRATSMPMASVRADFTATLLDPPSCESGHAAAGYPCGDVVVAAGVVGNGSASTGKDDFTGSSGVEMYDPARETWSGVGSLNEARVGQTASLLPDGKVLIAGSGNRVQSDYVVTYSAPLASAEVFDPLTQAWSETGAMAQPRGNHAAAVLDGPVCRGAAPPGYCGGVLVENGADSVIKEYIRNIPASDTAEVYTESPSISQLSPDHGGSDQATPVTIHGSGFTPGSQVTLDGASQPMTFESSTVIHTTAPPHPAAGIAEVVVSSGLLSSAAASATPASVFTYDGCVSAPSAGQVGYPAGYSLIGLPSGTAVPSQSLLYGWFDQGGGAYAAQTPDASTSVISGHGYWAWFSCNRVVTPAGAGASSVAMPLAAGHASIVGNPLATSPATVTGQDFAALWDPSLNGGAGGYHISGYQKVESLHVGEGVWVFSYSAVTVVISAGG